jgi:hypothetical protein
MFQEVYVLYYVEWNLDLWFYGDNMIYQKAIQQNIDLCDPQIHLQ